MVKQIKSVLLILFFISPLWADNPSTQYKMDKVLFQFDFNVSTGGTMYQDLSTHSYRIGPSPDGTGHSWVSGKHGGAASMNGNGGWYLPIKGGVDENVIQNFTCAVSFRQTGTLATGHNGILRQVDSGGADWGLSMDQWRPRFRWANNNTCSGTETVDLISSKVVSSGTWHHVVFTRKVNHYMRIYVDGVLWATSATGATCMNMTAGGDGVTLWTLGQIYTGANQFTGDIDDLTWWREALTEGEIKELYTQWNGRPRKLNINSPRRPYTLP